MKVFTYFPGIQLFDISGNKFSLRYVWIALFLFLAVCNPLFSENPPFQPVPPLHQLLNYNVARSHTFTVPAGVTSITVETWGGGGRGGSRTTGTDGTGGGGGGAYSRQVFAVTPGQVLNVNVGAGSSSNTAAGGDSWVSPGTVTTAFVLAKGGNSAASNTTTGATGGSSASGIGTIKFSGGNGANGVSTTSSGGGGSSAGTAANGTNASGTTGGVAPTNGGNGANGRTTAGSGTIGSAPGGGGSGAVRGTTGSPAGGNGGAGRVLISYDINVDAGPDQTQCQNARFVINSNIPPAGYSITWSVVSGNGFIYDNSNPVAEVTVPAGNTATIRLSLSNGTTTISDDVALTNTTSCTPLCTSPLNSNGDFELRGTATADNLSFQSTPATLIYQTTNPVGWSERYGTSLPNTSSFTGAYYINKTGANGNPKSGSRMVFMAGEGFCLSSLKTFADLTCGRTYRVSAWVAAFTNSATQTTSTFAMEFISGGNTVPDLHIGNSFMAPASTSWNNLNWQRYSFDVTIPSSGYEYADFLFTTLHNVNGIVIDDMCIEEISSASRANAGPDQFNCSNAFTLAANTPPSGFAGVWSVVSGSASISNTASPTSTATISSGNNARLRWTVNGTGGTRRYTALDPADTGGFESCCSPYDNGWTAINNGTNDWYTGSVPGAYSGTNAAYISNNGGTNHTYNITTAQTSHLYRDIKIHPDATNITLSFQWKGMGQASTDRLLVYTAPTSVEPVAGVPASTSTALSGATLVSGTNLTSSPFYRNATITLPSSLAGTTVRLIFTWQNNNVTGTNPPAAIDEISLSYNLPACSDFDEVNLLYSSTAPVNLNNVNACPGASTTLTPTGCSGGSLLWSTGATGSSITVNPVSTTTYSVTCTPAPSSNIFNNPGFESSTDLEYWDNWQGGSITTTPADVYAGSRALKLNALVTEYAGVAQGRNTTPGQKYRLSFYAKTNNSNEVPSVRFQFWDNNSIMIENGEGVLVTSTEYQYYSFEFVTPPTATWVSVFAEISDRRIVC
ncbi:MAG: carbohydrate binding domain-containing protein [Saprospiraceae bacterium]|nr:carbohydrate binding domain-containing protein [Saprospiraceae bacterium]